MEQHPEMLLIAIFREQLFSPGSQHFRCAAVILIVQKEVYVPRRPMARMKIVLCRTLSLYKAVADPVVFEYARQLGHDSVQPGIGPFHADGLNHQLPSILNIYNAYPQYQKFCQQAIQAAERAYAWAVKNPTVYYDQDGINEKFSPKISTGTYGDYHAEDEFFWAATEMYLTTKENAYLEQAKQFAPTRFSIPTWGQVEGLGLLQWLNQDILSTPEKDKFPIEAIKESLKEQCEQDIQALCTSSFHSVFGNKASDFIWGSNSEKCAGRGIAQMYQYALSKDNRYKDAALSTIDYLFGRNATGYCYLTGFGTQPVMHPHHRISTADSIAAPIPGLLAGGANAGKQDAAFVPPYPSDAPDECYQDNTGSYASNEIAINWNAYKGRLSSKFNLPFSVY